MCFKIFPFDLTDVRKSWPSVPSGVHILQLQIESSDSMLSQATNFSSYFFPTKMKLTERPVYRLRFQLLQKIHHHRFVNWWDYDSDLNSIPYSLNMAVSSQLWQKNTQILMKIASYFAIRRLSGFVYVFLPIRILFGNTEIL